MPIYVMPFYNAEGPHIAVGKHSEALANANAGNIAETIAVMKAEWNELRPEAMFVAAIRLFDLGRKDEAVYWFYSAGHRAILFSDLQAPGRSDVIGDEAFELGHAYIAFFQLAGTHITPYALQHPTVLKTTVKQVMAEGEKVPDFNTMYPGMVFVEKSKWPAICKESTSVWDDLLEVADEHAALFPNGFPKDALDDERGALNARHVWPDPQVVALAEALQDKRASEIDKLLAAGVDVNAKGIGGNTLLYWAVVVDNKSGYKRLLEHGANPNIETRSGDSVMHSAAGAIGDSEWVELALKHGGNPNLPCSRSRRCPNSTPIFDAIGSGNAEGVRLLIEAGAKLDHRDHENRTPLEYALPLGQIECVYQLVKAGAHHKFNSSDGKDFATIIREDAADPLLKTVWHDKILQLVDQDTEKEENGSSGAKNTGGDNTQDDQQAP